MCQAREQKLINIMVAFCLAVKNDKYCYDESDKNIMRCLRLQLATHGLHTEETETSWALLKKEE